MRGTIAITDHGWYQLLRQEPDLEEVNFWRPSPRRAFRGERWAPFLFKLRSPYKAICGFAFFERYARLDDWLAWDWFGRANGCSSLEEMRKRIHRLRAGMKYEGDRQRSLIGCVLLVQPVFFDEDAWIPQPDDWPPNVQTTKAYDLTSGAGKRVWDACVERLQGAPLSNRGDRLIACEPTERYGSAAVIRPRLGQGTFRVAVSEAYGWGCAMTGEHSRPALDAAHIRPYATDGPHRVENGLLLRADVHRLFDQGYITVAPDHRIDVSKRLRQDYGNGRTYDPLHGKLLHLPSDPSEHPAEAYLHWHREERYLA
jgi:HNH endonuclease